MYAKTGLSKLTNFPSNIQGSHAFANSFVQKKNRGSKGISFVDHRLKSTLQKTMQLIGGISIHDLQCAVDDPENGHFNFVQHNTGEIIQRGKVRNLIGTSRLKSIHGSWKNHYITAKKKKLGWDKCRVRWCRRNATVGAHVEVTKMGTSSKNRFIVPFCQKHNKMNTVINALKLKPGTYLVSVGKTRRVIQV